MSKVMLGLLLGSLLLTPASVYARSDAESSVWIERGQSAVRNRYGERRSVMFRNDYFHKTSDGIAAACGEFNAKNSFGAYIGFKHWIYVGVGGTFLETEIAEFRSLWNRLCAG